MNINTIKETIKSKVQSNTIEPADRNLAIYDIVSTEIEQLSTSDLLDCFREQSDLGIIKEQHLTPNFLTETVDVIIFDNLVDLVYDYALTI